MSASRAVSTAFRAVSRRSLMTSVRAGARPAIGMLAPRVASKALPQMMNTNQTRTMKTLDFGGDQETVYERSDYPRDKLLEVFKDDTLAILGYGPQGRGQALNMRDNGLNVIIGSRPGRSYDQAVDEGWVPGKTLFPIEEACDKGTVIMNLLSDAAQTALWDKLKPYLTKGKTLYFSHGFSVVYNDQTKIIPPKDIDVILVAPKGSGFTVRRLFQEGRGINSSFAVFQDISGKARERAIALGVGVGSGYLYETTFQKEVYSDLYGERGILMGAIQGMFQAQYDVLRANGHTPSEAFNETVEEATQSLFPLIGENGMDWMYSNCSTTAQRGALDWWRPFHDAAKPVFEKLYESVRNGTETARSLDKNSRPNYRSELEEELKEIRESEIWRTEFLRNHFIAGAGSLATAYAVMHPLDTLKTQIQAGSHRGFTKDVLRGLGKGFGVSVLGAAGQGGTRFATYEWTKAHLLPHQGTPSVGDFGTISATAISAIVGDLASSVIKVPREVITAKLQTDHYRHAGSTIRPTAGYVIRATLRDEGPVGLFRGFWTIAARDCPFMVILLTTYENFKALHPHPHPVHPHILDKLPHQQVLDIRASAAMEDWKADTPALRHVIDGGVSGFLAGYITTPMDVLRTRMITDKTPQSSLTSVVQRIIQSAPPYSSMFSQARSMYKAFFIGGVSRGLWWFGICSIFFPLYECSTSFLE
ncbi:hypothetical protein BZG36_02067 [Bifiguratus adelaidae]|uniref:ketol-acid reductoisomerase (NADP(+)) n=1 Tax=Bifiguratus adelaidae TaxID=1938954 RepID=A0A261Y1X3_9FUNG|nr:hypothetical protein BZG36_02067 [Bifiguratus adelaidae]